MTKGMKRTMTLSNNDRTFYHYQLLKKVRFVRSFSICYLLLAAISLSAAIYMSGVIGIAYVVTSWIVIGWVHYVTGRSVFVIDRYSYKGRWTWRWRMPWIGFLPQEQQFISHRYWSKILWHTTFITFIVIGIISPWLPMGLTLQLIFWHLWLMVPRIFGTLSALAEGKNGLVKLNESDLSVYKA